MLILLLFLLQAQQVSAKAEPLKVASGSQTLITVSVDVNDRMVEFHPENCKVEVLKSPEWLRVLPKEAVFEPSKPGVLSVQVPAFVASEASGRAKLSLKITVYYCNNFEGWCRSDTVEVVVPVEVSTEGVKVYSPPSVLPFIFAVVFLCCAFCFFFLPLFVRIAFALGFVVFGLIGAILHNEHHEAHQIATQLCVSCIGLERTYVIERAPRISERTKRFLANLKGSYEIVDFSAEWCTNCPYAKAVVEEFVKASGGRLRMRTIDVEKDADEAAKWPIKRGGRVVLPAIAVKTSEGVDVIFGAADLEQRLLQLLRRLEGKR